ncbi:MAG: hypothetical protein R3342_13425 [Lutibacter sp.]|uniref:hypothetical protein n=1 Tax=Lutibacter sp. TaxID=1925666 RepID=UPI00299CEF20|nr:hypothetical protein [Lutibacter sp.]MDX1830535.1 hypothetical protein [Lutibacter sp.]
MKKQLSILILFFIIGKIFACSCDTPKPILEFQSSKYVFIGKIISKTYANDSLTYTVTFDILKNYKNCENLKTLEFTFVSEGKYTGVYSSCDWDVDNGEKWLVYASKWKGKLTFGYYCSNSKPLDSWEISDSEQKVLDNGNSFKPENYIYEFELGFNRPNPISNIDSILKSGKNKHYKDPYSWLVLFIDNKGKLKKVTTFKKYKLKSDPIFNLATAFEIKKQKPLTKFERDAIKLVKKVKKWEIKRQDKTKIPVSYVRHLVIEFDEINKKWKYQL